MHICLNRNAVCFHARKRISVSLVHASWNKASDGLFHGEHIKKRLILFPTYN